MKKPIQYLYIGVFGVGLLEMLLALTYPFNRPALQHQEISY